MPDPKAPVKGPRVCVTCKSIVDVVYFTEDGRMLCAPCNVARLYSILEMLHAGPVTVVSQYVPTGPELFESFMAELRKRAMATGREPGDLLR